MNIAQAKDVLLMVAEGDQYEREYAGRIELFCCYCHENMESSEHDAECAMLLARQALGEEWTRIIQQNAHVEQQLAQQEAKQRL